MCIAACLGCAHLPAIRSTAMKVSPWPASAPANVRLMVVGQDPTLTSGRTVPVAMQMNQPRSRLAHYVFDHVMAPLGVRGDEVYVTDLVRCWFRSPPRTLGVLAPAAANCVRHLEDEIAALRPAAILTLGNPVFEFLKRRWNLMAGPMRSVFAIPIHARVRSHSFIMIPCVHLQTYQTKPLYRRGQDARLRRVTIP
jgi:uracil-DNA glycosylase family 4